LAEEEKMERKGLAGFFLLCIGIISLATCGGEQAVDVKKIMSQPKTFVGADTCKQCHLEHYDSWKMTLHSRTLGDPKTNKDAILVALNEKEIRKDLAKLSATLKVPADQIYIPKESDVLYTIGSQWAQRFIVDKGGTWYVAPIQYSVDTNRWLDYYESEWDKRPWFTYCGGCHSTGADLQKKTFNEARVGCEACHGKGSWHAALPKTAVFEKRQTIVNPAKLTQGIAAQICGSCHQRGMSTKAEGAHWPVGFEPGEALHSLYQPSSYEGGDVVDFYPNGFSRGHHQQYNDWQKSSHYREGVTCTSCHYVHQIGLPPTRSQTFTAGSKQCFQCHEILNKLQAHNFHSFATCVGCHMPRIGMSVVSGDLHSHVFKTLVPKETLDNPGVPNSCQTCHAHKDADLKKLQEKSFPGSMEKEQW
jgi:hypothetical protein